MADVNLSKTECRKVLADMLDGLRDCQMEWHVCPSPNTSCGTSQNRCYEYCGDECKKTCNCGAEDNYKVFAELVANEVKAYFGKA